MLVPVVASTSVISYDGLRTIVQCSFETHSSRGSTAWDIVISFIMSMCADSNGTAVLLRCAVAMRVCGQQILRQESHIKLMDLRCCRTDHPYQSIADRSAHRDCPTSERVCQPAISHWPYRLAQRCFGNFSKNLNCASGPALHLAWLDGWFSDECHEISVLLRRTMWKWMRKIATTNKIYAVMKLRMGIFGHTTAQEDVV